jgi:plasmid stabilization system protein ParE
VKVELSGEADRQVEVIDAWWRENRPGAPDLFASELEQALTALADSPTLGVRYGSGETPIKRLLLHRSHYHLYFVQEPNCVLVLALWNAFRGRGPAL